MVDKVDTAEGLLLELAQHLQHDAGLNEERFPGRRVGMLNLALTDGALWRRVVEFLGGEPEMQRDVVIPALMRPDSEVQDEPPYDYYHNGMP